MSPTPDSPLQWRPHGGGWTLALAGDWRGEAALRLPQPPPAAAGVELTIDAHALTAWDMGLAATLREHLAPLARGGAVLQLESLPADVQAVLQLALPQAGSTIATPVHQVPPEGLAAIGHFVLDTAVQAGRTTAFVGEVLLALGRLLRGRSGLRAGELLRQIDQTGPLSIGIVSLTCFLVGVMLAYMGGAQLDRLGAQAFIADIVTVGMVRELAGLLTGVILAGRVGSAFAAQLATMKAGEEIDALRALGVDPIDHLVLPRILALVLVAPLVMAYAALVGILAGALPASLVYGVPVAEYLHKCRDALTWTHLWIGVFKCTLYAVLLAVAGCREGLFAGRNAQAVGEATTRAVVKGLVWIIAAACLSTVVFQSLGF
jgi:phospholipid/cholesterol/gamma-HCH transport system permease protein